MGTNVTLYSQTLQIKLQVRNLKTARIGILHTLDVQKRRGSGSQFEHLAPNIASKLTSGVLRLHAVID